MKILFLRKLLEAQTSLAYSSFSDPALLFKYGCCPYASLYLLSMVVTWQKELIGVGVMLLKHRV